MLSIPFFSLRLGANDAGSDPASSTTRQAYDTLAQGFGPGFNGPLLLTSRAGTDMAAVRRVVDAVSAQPGVASVSPARILSGPVGHVVAIDVYPATSPQAAASPPQAGGRPINHHVTGRDKRPRA